MKSLGSLKIESDGTVFDFNPRVPMRKKREKIISNARVNWEQNKLQSKYCTDHRSKSHNVSNLNSKLTGIQGGKSSNASILMHKQIDIACRSRKQKEAFAKTKSNNPNYFRSFDVKLPPIILPILRNLANPVLPGQDGKSSLGEQAQARETIYKDSSDSDLESSESHPSLKSGLKKNLISYSAHNALFKSDREDNPEKSSAIVYECYLDRVSSKSHQSRDASSGCGPATTNISLREIKMSGRFGEISKALKMDQLDASKSNGRSRIESLSGQPLQRTLSVDARDPAPGVDYLAEIAGQCLNIYGQGALRYIDKQHCDLGRANDINFVKFNYVHFNSIAMCLNKIKYSFPNVDHFIFKETNISHLGQLNALAESQGLNSITIESDGNPIISKNWKIYAIFRLAHWGLQMVNGVKVTEENIQVANLEFAGLTDIVMWSLPEALLEPLLERLCLDQTRKKNGENISAKQFLLENDSTLRNVVGKEALQWRRGSITQDDLIWRHKGKNYLSRSIENTVAAIEKLNIFQIEWPTYLFEIIYNILKDYSNMYEYMKSRTKELQ
ncbi:uncharacterized protein LOC106660293 [Trichogramma pretiosum]|uniref:uncharacterized protein LOC106660293 n=1 Tax=Trichogramma pretiosum TaxID=7493 RepID=UPI0006C9751E|nr:uncharacterized protein LOC106660293 [Trichogramma pretiosum]